MLVGGCGRTTASRDETVKEEEEDESVKKTGAGFLFWYSQTVFIFLCIYCLESNLVNFYSS